MVCECAECAQYEGPNPRTIKLRFFVLAAQFLVGVVGLVKARSWKALGAFFGSLAFFATIPRMLICCRCENYGKMCYSLYIGKLTSMYLPQMEGEITPFAMALVAATLATIANAPAIGMRKNKKLLGLYMMLSSATMALQFLHSCRHCARYATDWRKDCPSAKTARLFFGAGRDIAL
jgi:hypothetical protein